MNIPIELLRKVPSSTFAYHQGLSKKMIKIQNNTSALAKKSIDQDNAFNPSIFQSKVIKWFFNQEPSTRLKLCSIQNKYLILMLHQMRLVYQKYISNIYFRIIQECKDDINMETLPYSSFYQKIEPRFIKMHKYEGREAEEQFLKEIRFLSTNEYNDVITLSHNLIQNEDLFKRLFCIISNNKCFEESIKAYQEQDDKYYNFEFPNWIRRKSELTLGEIVLMYFEQVIQINYSHFKYFNELYSYPYYEKIQEIIDTSVTLIGFISESSNKVELYNTILYNGIRKAIKDDAMICDLIKKYEEQSYVVFAKNKTLSEQIDDTNMKLRSIYLDTHSFITEITFISFSNLFKVEDFVYKKILKHFIGLYQKKNVDDLLNEEEVKVKPENKKKKKKKKNKNKKENSVDENNSITLPSSSEPKSNIEESKVNINNTTDTPIAISNKEDDENVPNTKNESVLEESIHDNDSEKNEEDEEKVIIKKKPFFLYPINTKTNKNNISKKKQKESSVLIIPKQTEKHKITETIEKNNEKKGELQQCISSIVNLPQSTNLNNSNNNSTNISSNNPLTSSNDITNKNNFILMSNWIPYEYPNYYTNLNSIYPSYNLFYLQLSKEIDEFTSNVLFHKELLNKTLKDTINRLTTLIINSLQTEYVIKIDFYGSYATDLSIESSDIDMLIHFKPIDPIIEPQIETIIFQLSKSFIDEKDFLSKVEPILTASVPVIKLECNILKSLDSETTESIRNNYAFNFDEIFTIKFDITFAIMDPLKVHPTIKVVQYIKEAVVVFLQIKPVLYVLKRYLQIHKLNSTFHGGLSSFSLFLLLFAFMKIRNRRPFGSGEVLFDFFDFYSKFDYSHYTINVNLDNPFVYHVENTASPISILDPFTLLNVAKSSFLIREVKSAFAKALNYLIKYNYKKCGTENSHTYIINGLFAL